MPLHSFGLPHLVEGFTPRAPLGSCTSELMKGLEQIFVARASSENGVAIAALFGDRSDSGKASDFIGFTEFFAVCAKDC